MKSHIAIFDLNTRSFADLIVLDGHFEAPNWHPSGEYLLINGDGLLFKVPLDNPRLIALDTGFAQKSNNDHGFSPDGKTLFLSDKSETGKSTIYALPAGGGIPKRLSHTLPSYWHGVSPDGAQITYAGFRNGICEILTSDSDGGNERQLTAGFDHCDGPDYSADGKWIWFNAETKNNVELYRIRKDGSDCQKMSNDNKVNWFPHPSPDGEHVVYLAYPEGTQGHPANLEVELRLMPQTGGQFEILTALFGGQGTINVPSWSPDSARFAFAHYSS